MKRLVPAVLLLLFASNASAHTWSRAQIDDLEVAARAAPQEGLPAPEAEIERLLQMRRVSEIDSIYDPALFLAADDLFRDLAQTYAQGAIDPETVDREWRIARPAAPDYEALLQAIDAGALPGNLLQALLPRSSEYNALRAELAHVTAGQTQQRLQLRANLERWRWLPRNWPDSRVEVRVSEYQLYYHRPGATPLQHEVIVGAVDTPSPVFAAVMESVTLNPEWDPPSGIVLNELLPRLRRNPAAADRDGFEALDTDGRPVAEVDWSARPFPYRVRQRPGQHNALGRLRFNLPNPFAVYLHDTPARSLFARTNRALSHGCIRVKDPVSLAAAMLGGSWTEADLNGLIDQDESQIIALATPIPVYVLYLTTAADADGSVRYLDDIYDRDDAIVAALDTPRIATIARTEDVLRCR